MPYFDSASLQACAWWFDAPRPDDSDAEIIGLDTSNLYLLTSVALIYSQRPTAEVRESLARAVLDYFVSYSILSNGKRAGSLYLAFALAQADIEVTELDYELADLWIEVTTEEGEPRVTFLADRLASSVQGP